MSCYTTYHMIHMHHYVCWKSWISALSWCAGSNTVHTVYTTWPPQMVAATRCYSSGSLSPPIARHRYETWMMASHVTTHVTMCISSRLQ